MGQSTASGMPGNQPLGSAISATDWQSTASGMPGKQPLGSAISAIDWQSTASGMPGNQPLDSAISATDWQSTASGMPGNQPMGSAISDCLTREGANGEYVRAAANSQAQRPRAMGESTVAKGETIPKAAPKSGAELPAAQRAILRLRAMEEPARKDFLYKTEFSELKKLAEEMSISIRNNKKSGSRKNKRPEGSKSKNELVDGINNVIIARLAERPLRPSEQALERRRLMNRPKSHIVVLEALLEEINRLN